jgi:hypothetical protein
MIARLALCLWLLPTLAAAQSHPCDGPYPSDGGTLQEGPHTLRWCFSELDRRGTPTTVTARAVYSSGTREVLQASEVTAGTANAFGLRLYSAPVVVDVVDTPPAALEIAAINDVGEGPRSSALSLTVTAAPDVPSAPLILGVQ